MDLHVTNIAPTVTQIELRAHFEHVVPVAGVKLLPGGDALVTFDTGADADKALEELDGSMLSGRALSMRKALPRREREDDIRSKGGALERQDKEDREPGR